jgi:uncharacterized protein YjiS (DUF1127 family)
MSTIYTASRATRLGRSSGSSTQRLLSLIRKHWEAFLAWRLRQELHARFEALSDRELTDIGITRGEIDYLVRGALSGDPRDHH